MTYPQSAPPYFDDYNAAKNYQSILFKPGLAVQTRELNQMQTIQQSQIQRLGNSIYQNYSVVSGGKTTVNTNVISVKLLSTYGGSGINVTPLTNLYAQGATSGLIGLIMLPVVATSSNPNVLIYQIVSSGSNAGLFIDAELINIYTDQACTIPYNVTVQVATGSVINTTITTANANSITIVVNSGTGIAIGQRVVATTIPTNVYVTGVSGTTITLNSPLNFNIPASTAISFYTDNSQPTTLVSISQGIYYVDGYFLDVEPQTIVLDLFFRSSNYIIGLTHDVTIVTAQQDNTLLDNASGSYNYAAPGADRLQIPLMLSNIPLTTNSPSNLISSNFFEILRIANGIVQSQSNLPVYSDIGHTLARRTYDESGNYVVKPFKLTLSNDGLLNTTVKATLSSGKAYVKGNEVKKISNTVLKVNHALNTQSITNFDVSTFFGAYAIVTAPTKSIPQIGSGLAIEIHNVTSGYSSGTKIGTANIRYLSYNSGSGATVNYNAYLFNIVLSGSNTFASALSFITTATLGVYSTITMSLQVAAAGIISGNTQLFNSGSNYSSLVFPISQNYISTVPLVEYTNRRVFKGITFSGGIATISGNNQYEQFLGGSGVIASATAIQYFTVVATSTSGTYTAGQFIPLDLSSRTVTITPGVGVAGQATINVNDGTFNGICDIEATLFLSNDARRTKTLVSNYNVAFASPTSTMSLGVSDVFQIVGIYDSQNISVAATTSNLNITANYTLDTGMRDTHYDFGNISLNAGASAPTGQVLIVINYFTHSGGNGFLAVDSYGIPYTSIPTYTDSTGVQHQLRDCLDFRPRRTDGSASLLFPTFYLPDPTFALINESYYLSRIDKIVMTSSGNFQVLSGIPAYTNPQPPADLPDAMTLYTLVIPAYTANASLVTVIPANNRRYTMNDIANLDTRLTNVEAYTALNLLEQSVTNTTLTNLSGTTLYQNGFLTEGFVDFTVSDVNNTDFKCSIDTTNKLACAPFSSANLSMNYYSSGSTSQKTGYLVTAPYSQTPFVTQNLATKYININPYNVFSNVGQLTLTPNNDVWYDTTSLPIITNSPQAATAVSIAQSKAIANGQSAVYGDWIQWLTPPASSTTTFGLGSGSTQVSTTSYTIQATTQTVSSSLQPYMRSVPVSYSVTGLTPFGTVYAWIDEINISSYITPSGTIQQPQGVTNYIKVSGGTGYTSSSVITISITGGGGSGATANYVLNSNGTLSLTPITFGSGYTTMPTVTVTNTGPGSGASFTANNANTMGMPIICDVHGNASGTITIPNNSIIKIPSGTHNITFSDNTDNPITAMAYATATYSATGYIDIDQTCVSTSASTQTTVKTPQAPIVVPVSTPSIPVFADSSLTESQAIAQIMAANNYPSSMLSTVTTQMNIVLAAYNNNPISQANPSRTVVNSSGTVLASGLPDLVGAISWTTGTLSEGLNSTATTAAINAGFVTNSALEAVGITATITVPTNKPQVIDPLAESFFIDATKNPNGIFLTSVDIFFASADPVNPCYVELRTMNNGYPTETVIPYSAVTLMPSAITTSTNGTTATNVKFQAPVYLSPGQYAVVLKSDSNQFNVFVAEFGKVLLSGNATVTQQPYIGAFFESQNGSTWTANQSLSLCFVLYQAKFTTGSSTFYLNASAPSAQFNYDLLHLTAQELNFSGITTLSPSVASTPLSGGGLGSYTPFLENTDYQFTVRQEVTGSSDLMVNYVITTNSSDVSPVVDLSRSSAILIQNYINAPTFTIPETTNYGGSALAKYVSQKVVLATGLHADNLIVYLNVNRPASTAIQVYYKVQNQFDTTPFINLPWTLLNQEVNGGFTTQNGAVVQDKWSSYGISYTNGATYSNFNTFQIKIVLTSTNPSYSPSISSIREIATA